ncbi:hypothetical protein [uncultured Sphingomonas sp.]|uniref:hypothetical protein n=1 Tax=uncultured Sphingomonas sp. TaxID=158754 RepID=UPI0026230901|nr:hypothetical protein [uncultured Sphingomonas sp.]
MSAIDSSSVLQGSGWLAHRYDPVLDSFHFVEVPRAAQSGATFLTDEFLPDTPPLHVATRAQVIAAAPHTAPIHYIFHSAFCCSTLLARALDRPGLAIALKEPVVLNDLVGWRRRGGKDGDVAAVLDSALTLLARPFAADEAVVIKPSNIVAGISNAMLAMRPDSRAVLMYTPLRAYLGSIAKKGLWGRLWVRDLFVGLLQDRLIDLGIAAADHIKLTDLQIAAVGWLAQHALFARMLARHGGTRVRSLDSETMLASPEEALRAVFALFGWGGRLDLVSRIIADGAFARHSKDAVPFAAADRRDAQIAAADAHADEIEKVAIWAETVAQRVGIAFTLAHPLI